MAEKGVEEQVLAMERLHYFIDFSLLFFENFRNFSLHIRSPPLLFCCPSITKQSGGSIWLL